MNKNLTIVEKTLKSLTNDRKSRDSTQFRTCFPIFLITHSGGASYSGLAAFLYAAGVGEVCTVAIPVHLLSFMRCLIGLKSST